ncbi:MAG: hypothetical protein ACJ790_11325 [Myxococcaceae bacterium]
MKRAVIAVAVLVSFGAMAQTDLQQKRKPARQEVIFTTSDIFGLVEKPGTGIILAPPKAHFDSLIRVRANFNPELQKSVESL